MRNKGNYVTRGNYTLLFVDMAHYIPLTVYCLSYKCPNDKESTSFVMNRLLDLRSKNCIGKGRRPLMHNHNKSNSINIVLIEHDGLHKNKGRDRRGLISVGYVHSKIFGNKLNFYTYMEENHVRLSKYPYRKPF